MKLLDLKTPFHQLSDLDRLTIIKRIRESRLQLKPNAQTRGTKKAVAAKKAVEKKTSKSLQKTIGKMSQDDILKLIAALENQ